MNDGVDNVEDELIQWVTFHLEGELYGVNVMQVQEVLRVSEIVPVPGAPDYVTGIINLRGSVVTVIDTRKRFGLPEKAADEQTRIVIIESMGQVIGMLVDGVAEVIDLYRSKIETAPNVGNEESSRFIQGVFSNEGTLLILIDVDKLLTNEEWSEVSDL